MWWLINNLLLLFLIFLNNNNNFGGQVKAIEYKLRESKPNPHRCAYHHYYNNNNKQKTNIDEEKEQERWILKPSATACLDELAIIWPKQQQEEQTKNKKKKREENNKQQKTLCQQIFEKKEGEEDETILRSAACDNEWIQPLARKCRSTCGTCCELPEFQCEDQAHSEDNQNKYRHHLEQQNSSFSCYTIKDINNKCKKTSVWYPTLADHCQATCGLCEFEEKKIQERKRKRSQIDEDDSIEESRRDLKIPRNNECKDRRGEKYCLSKVLTKGNACKYKPRILDRCQKSCGVCFPRREKCRNKKGYERRCKRWNNNNFCLGTKFSLAIKLHYCQKECQLCDIEDDEEEEKSEEDL